MSTAAGPQNRHERQSNAPGEYLCYDGIGRVKQSAVCVNDALAAILHLSPQLLYSIANFRRHLPLLRHT